MTEATATPAAVVTTEATPAAPWHGIADADTASYISNKGWVDLPSVVKSYREVEKHVGRDPSTLLAIPKDGDEAGYRALYQKLGMPEKADAYDMRLGLPKEVKVDEDFAKQVQTMFHGAGLTKAQAEKLAKSYNEYALSKQTAAEKDAQLNLESDRKALLGEWKGGHERMLNAAKTAVKTLGLTEPVLDAIESSLGYAGTMKLFADLGMKLGEDKFISSGDAGRFSGQMTPAEAKAEWDRMKTDLAVVKAMGDKMNPGHDAAAQKQKRLFEVMYPTER